MAVRLIIRAFVRGQRDVDNLDRSVRRIGTSTAVLERGFRQARLALAGFLTVRGIQELSRNFTSAADQITRVGNGLRAAGISANELVAAQADIQRIANETRSSYEATGQLVGRVLRSTRDLGISQQQGLDIAQTFQQSLALSGANTQEAAAAALQFGQALASGRLQGDELRSILENNSVFARELAEELGVGVGQLRQLGSEGRITSEVLAAATLRFGEDINESFGQLSPTFEQATTVLQNGLVQASADLGNLFLEATRLDDRFINLGRTLSNIFGREGNQFQDILGSLRTGLESLDVSGLASNIQRAIRNAITNGFDRLRELDIGSLLSRFLNFFADIDWLTVLSEVGATMVHFATQFINFIADIDWGAVLVGLFRAIVAIPVALFNGLVSLDWVPAVVGLGRAILRIPVVLFDALVQVFRAAVDFFADRIQAIFDGVRNFFRGINPLNGNDIQDNTDAQNNSAEADRESDTSRSDLLSGLRDTINTLNTPAPGLAEQTSGLGQNTMSNMDLDQSLDDLIATIGSGGAGGSGGRTNLTFAESLGEDLVTNLSNGLSEALRTGNFSNVFDSFLNTITSSIIGQFSNNLIEGLFENVDFGSIFGAFNSGGAGGGIGGALSSIFGGFFQNGGIAPGGRASIVGEAGPEVIVPSEDVGVIPNDELGGTTVNITNNITGDISRQTRQEIMSLTPQIADSVQSVFVERRIF